MELKIEITGLDGLVEAINNLADAVNSGKAADAVIEKARKSTTAKAAKAKEEPAPVAEKPEPDSQPTTTSDTQSSAPESATAESTTSSAAPAASAEPPADDDLAKLAEEYPDEKLRALAAEKVKINKEAVKAIVTKYASTVSEVPLTKRPDFVAELNAVSAK